MTEEISATKNLIRIPQVALLSCHEQYFNLVVQWLIKKIICDSLVCSSTQLCLNCHKFNQNIFIGLFWKKYNWQNSIKKNDVEIFAEKIWLTNLDNAPKILVIEQIEYATKAAGNSMLKLLENLPKQVFIIFVTSNITRVLPTIQSRAQVITFSEAELMTMRNNSPKRLTNLNWWEIFFPTIENLSTNEITVILSLVTKFITNDNQHMVSFNFLMIKEIVKLKERAKLFLQILKLIIHNKIYSKYQFNINEPDEIKKLRTKWLVGDQEQLATYLNLVAKTIAKIDNKTNLLLLFNYFMINFYQGTTWMNKKQKL